MPKVNAQVDHAQLVSEVGGLFAQARTFARRRSLHRLLEASVSLPHLHVLTILTTDGPRSMSDLARALGVSFASATGIVTRMEERGLCSRMRAEDDRRVVIVQVSPAGVRTLDEIEGRSREHMNRLLGKLTVSELEQLRGGFAALQRAGLEMASAETRSPRGAA